MLAKTPVQTRFYYYVCGKDPDESYNWCHRQECACGQFLRDENIELDAETNAAVWGGSYWPGDVDRTLNNIALGEAEPEVAWTPWSNSKQWTFGELRKRLEAAGIAG